ncbi:hypothetical protein K8O96_11940 [Clostridium sporogenes]|uniref:Uncharacterized protein n=1 Tax=Clostridium botulinum TaxID=1491 RepID=A0A6M0SX09_CLOBO|nr:hypothetical protein [Clostridium sporogenes]NFA59495.1 hypothetical protein [Clostridium botulinum]NFI74679.1 hypothetical protein [Clostridium sporogenes]NFL71186.1 hypothetical protein [Clostridium sporogenes]NFM26216.1 hypothetical protein [Clostridium sporogenes]NFP62459.1 hypothetical protein [Clostridium sporogenes]
MIEINLELYDFLKEHETHLYHNEGEPEKVEAITFVDFDELTEFQNAVGIGYFESDNPMEVFFMRGYICIQLNDIFEYQGNCIKDYKNCFEEDYDDFKSILEEEE